MNEQDQVKQNPETLEDQEECRHRITGTMRWPDEDTSELCRGCLMTRHHDEGGISEWQDHNYTSTADWYREAETLQRQIDSVLDDNALKAWLLRWRKHIPMKAVQEFHDIIGG